MLLGGLANTDIPGNNPLSPFQHTVFEKEDFYKLITAINEAQGPTKRTEISLKTLYEKCWDDLEMLATQAGSKREKKPEKTKNTDDMLRELLEMTSEIVRNQPSRRGSIFATKYQPAEPPPRDVLKTSIMDIGLPESVATRVLLAGCNDLGDVYVQNPEKLTTDAELTESDWKELTYAFVNRGIFLHVPSFSFADTHNPKKQWQVPPAKPSKK